LEACSPLLPDGMRCLIVTHDVDWPRNGPGTAHILARQNRFDAGIIRKVVNDDFNPYFGVPTIMEIEERFDFRSTFFFRPEYDDGSQVQQYEDTIKVLVKNGWEVGLHANTASSVGEVVAEKKALERVTGKPVYGSRVHYLRVSANTFSNLAEAQIKYDSSLTYEKEKINPKNTGYQFENDLVVFPITFMDAYLFTYMGLTEKTVTNFVIKKIDKLFASGVQIMTLLWHDNSVMMKGGRAYSGLMEKLASKSDVTFLKGIDAFELVQRAKNEMKVDESHG
jgi:peptidoglycan/xylan/chitin deacetylase (PgdA/CDA1 family)